MFVKDAKALALKFIEINPLAKKLKETGESFDLSPDIKLYTDKSKVGRNIKIVFGGGPHHRAENKMVKKVAFQFSKYLKKQGYACYKTKCTGVSNIGPWIKCNFKTIN